MRYSLIFFSLTFFGGVVFTFLFWGLRERYKAQGYMSYEELNAVNQVTNE